MSVADGSNAAWGGPVNREMRGNADLGIQIRGRMELHGTTYRMLQTCDENLPSVKPLPVLPKDSGHPNCMFSADCSGQRREVIVWTTPFIALRGLVFVHGEWAMEKDQA